jgi:hypothetical protein
MNKSSEFPRVLIINHSRINAVDPHGVSIRTWFAEWPRENLAQIYSGGESDDEGFCEYNFKLAENERRFGKIFFKIKGSSLGQSSYVATLDKNDSQLSKISFLSLIKYRLSNFLINTGLWEIIFSPKLSDKLRRFIQDFSPDVIYCQGYNLTFTWLPAVVHKEFNIPVCFQTGDDWPSYLYRNSPIYFLIKPIVHRSLLTLLSLSGARLSNGKLMASDYAMRYHLSFEPLMMCDDPVRFQEAIPKRSTDKDTLSILYSGSLGNGRWLSIIDICDAAMKISLSEAIKITVTVFTSVVPKEAVNRLQEISNLKIMPSPLHEELPSYLKGADILFLPETFNPEIAKAIRLSISTKAHLYMMSEKPVLMYGSPITGIVDYAKTGQWAHIVDQQGVQKLVHGLNEMIKDPAYCQQLVENGNMVVSENHDRRLVTARLLKILKKLPDNEKEKIMATVNS